MSEAPRHIDTLDPAARAALREAVVETIAKGWHPPRRPRRPRHKPIKDEAWDRFLSVKDSCRIAAELIAEYGPEAIMAGAFDDEMRSRAEVTIREAGKRINDLIAFLDLSADAKHRSTDG